MYDCPKMRRALSICLIFFFAFGPLSAVFQAGEESRLPACCRRDGAHHCAMSEDALARIVQASGATHVLTAPAHCPLYPGTAPATVSRVHAPTVSFSTSFALLSRAYSPRSLRPAVCSTESGTFPRSRPSDFNPSLRFVEPEQAGSMPDACDATLPLHSTCLHVPHRICGH